MSWDQIWNDLDSKLDQFQIDQNRIIRRNQINEPSPWLEKIRWTEYLGGLDRSILLGLIEKPDTELLDQIWSIFDGLAQKAQRTLANTGIFARFEVVRTEKNQSRAKPFRTYQNPARILTYDKPWKQILAFFVRTQEISDEIDPETFPKYQFTKEQLDTYRIFVDLVKKQLEKENESISSSESSSNLSRAFQGTPDESAERTSSLGVGRRGQLDVRRHTLTSRDAQDVRDAQAGADVPDVPDVPVDW